jgi:hypothetical protein
MGVPAAMVYLYSLDEDDVKPERLHLYRELKPILDNLFKRIFLDED